MSQANGYTDTSVDSYGGTFGGAGLVQQAYDRLVEMELRDEPLLRSIVDKKPSPSTLPGSTVSLQIRKALPLQTGELNEITDPTPIALQTPDIINLVLKERGASTIGTIRLDTFALTGGIDRDLAQDVAINMVDSTEALVLAALLEGTNVRFGSDAVDATGTISAADVRFITAKLRGNKAKGRRGAMYWAGIHPDVAHDLRAENAGANWRDPHTYVDTANIYNGEIGAFEGAFFVESPRLVPTDGVYPTIFAGQQALAEAVAIEPHVVVGNVTDPLKRKMPVGWHGILGHAIYRDQALYRVESSSSIAPGA